MPTKSKVTGITAASVAGRILEAFRVAENLYADDLIILVTTVKGGKGKVFKRTTLCSTVELKTLCASALTQAPAKKGRK